MLWHLELLPGANCFERCASKLSWVAFVAFLISVLANWQAVWNPLSAFFAAVWFGILVLGGATREGGALQRVLLLQPLRNYGRCSYCIYVIHLLVFQHVMLLSRRFRDELHVPRLLAFILGVLAGNAAVYWLASLSFKRYEAPILRLKERLAASRKSSSTASGFAETQASIPPGHLCPSSAGHVTLPCDTAVSRHSA